MTGTFIAVTHPLPPAHERNRQLEDHGGYTPTAFNNSSSEESPILWTSSTYMVVGWRRWWGVGGGGGGGGVSILGSEGNG